MDWFRQVPIGQYVSGKSSWLRSLDPRLKFAWVLMFLLTPILAEPAWRIGLVVGLLLMTVGSFLPVRLWWRSLLFLTTLSLLVGFLSMLLPTGEPSAILDVRFPKEIPGIDVLSPAWEVFRIGPFRLGPINLDPFIIDRRSAELGIKTSTLIFTVIHSVNLMLITTPPEDLMWSLRWFMSPIAFLGLPVDRISFQLLLALRFLPLVQEEFQNLLRALASRSVNIRKLGLKAFIGILLSVVERFLANILLRAEQGADALIARGGLFVPPDYFQPKTLVNRRSVFLNIGSFLILLFVLSLRGQYGVY